MAQFHRPKLNNWLLTLVLASIGLHGFVLALPMPDLAETPPEIEAPLDSDVIQVVTLPKLATVPEANDSPLPPPPPEPPPQEPAPVEEPVVDIVITNPEILEEIEPEFIEDDFDDSELVDDLEDEFVDAPEEPLPDESEDHQEDIPDENTPEPTLEQRIANRDSYQNFDGTQVGNTYVSTSLLDQYPAGDWPSPLHALAGTLPEIVVPLQDCLDDQPGDSITVLVEIGPDAQIIGVPETLNSTGYEVLDEQAVKIASEADYAAYHDAGKTKEYMLEIDVDYKACARASVLTNTQATG